jgi:hypothetical protein
MNRYAIPIAYMLAGAIAAYSLLHPERTERAIQHIKEILSHEISQVQKV